jgi:hypothetical protein
MSSELFSSNYCQIFGGIRGSCVRSCFWLAPNEFGRVQMSSELVLVASNEFGRVRMSSELVLVGSERVRTSSDEFGVGFGWLRTSSDEFG